MNSIFHIIKREFLSRIRKKSFIVMCILGPVIFTVTLIMPAWIEHHEEVDVKTIAVVDSSHLFYNKITNTSHLKFIYLEPSAFKEIKKTFRDKGYWGVLYITHVITYTPDGVLLFSYKQASLSTKIHIKHCLEKEIEKQKLMAHDIKNIENILQAVNTSINIRVVKLYENGLQNESNDDLNSLVAWACGFLIYFFIFFFGSQVMRGVLEEKTSRIVEVIFSSVKPFNLMLGKIIGIGMVGLTQFFIWCILTLGLLNTANRTFFPELFKSPTEIAVAQDIMMATHEKTIDESTMAQSETAAGMKEMIEAFHRINFGFIITSFLIFFIGGYLLYGSLYAAIGSAGDSDMDIQQFVLPVTIPLIFAMFLLFNTVKDPDSAVSVFASIFPLTSPIIMMARIPFGVPASEFILSIIVLLATFIFTTWLSGKIYRTGILMYGKKIGYKEIWKWLRY